MCAAFLGGGWWVFPLIGFVICAGVMLVAFRFGRGCMGMGRLRGVSTQTGDPSTRLE